MSVWLVVPVRSLRDGKRRLAPALDREERAALVERLFVRTLEQGAAFPGAGRTVVVTACDAARAIATAFGAHVLDEASPHHGPSRDESGLNSALGRAQHAIAELGGTQMIVVPADLPALQPDDLRALGGGAALAPDRRREGTNGISVPAAPAFDFSFGERSFARHLDRVREMNLEPTIVERPGLAFDVDLPGDLIELRRLAPELMHLLV